MTVGQTAQDLPEGLDVFLLFRRLRASLKALIVLLIDKVFHVADYLLEAYSGAGMDLLPPFPNDAFASARLLRGYDLAAAVGLYDAILVHCAFPYSVGGL